MIPSPPPAELRQLIDQLLDEGKLSRPEMARLEVFLEDDAHLAYYLEVTEQEVFLKSVLEDSPVSSPTADRRVEWRKFLVPLGLAAAACVVFFAGHRIGISDRPESLKIAPAGSVPPARITGLMGVTWVDESPPDLVGTSGASRRLEIKSGLTEITYANGVRLTLEGPASFEILSATSGRLGNGKLVADVPKGAEGFRIDYRNGAVVDLGTEFAMEVKSDAPTEVGVFRGEVEIHRDGTEPMPLFENQAVIHDWKNSESPIQAVPFDHQKYVRQLPSRDFAWAITKPSPAELVFDVSHLLWKPSKYRAIFKWINGIDGIAIRNVELRLNGASIAKDLHQGQTGLLAAVRDNIFELEVPDQEFRHGVWTLHAVVGPLSLSAMMPDIARKEVRSLGILQFEEGLVTAATREDFIGRWSYRHLGALYVREFHPDGTVTLSRDGVLLADSFVSSRWWVADAVLRVDMPPTTSIEDHVLRDRDTLIFTGRPYENAVRDKSPRKDG